MELDSPGLMNFFLNAADGETYFYPDADEYEVPVDAVTSYLDGYFETYLFKPEEVTLNRYEAKEQKFVLPAFAGRSGPLFIDPTGVSINKDGFVILTADFLHPDTQAVTTHGTMVIKVTNENRFICSYQLEMVAKHDGEA